MIAGRRQHRRVIVPVRLIELIVIVFGLAEIVDDVAEQQGELRDLQRLGFLEVANHLVGYFVLGLGPARAAAIAGRVEHDLSVLLNRRDGAGMPPNTSFRSSRGSVPPRGAGNGIGFNLCSALSLSMTL